MFNKENREVNFKEAETIIGPSVKVKGNFYGEGNMIIDGIVEGSVKTSKNLLVGEKAKINANVEAAEATIGGEVCGNVKINGFLELTTTAKITGDLEVGELSIARGAIFNGKCTISSSIKTAKTTSTVSN